MLNIKLTVFQRNNLLQMLNRVPLTGYDEANALLELVSLIQSAEEESVAYTDAANQKKNPKNQ